MDENGPEMAKTSFHGGPENPAANLVTITPNIHSRSNCKSRLAVEIIYFDIEKRQVCRLRHRERPF